MRESHKEAYRLNARATLQMINANANQDFHTLSSAQIDALLIEADRVHYQKPVNANGSRARYFFARLQRQAN